MKLSKVFLRWFKYILLYKIESEKVILNIPAETDVGKWDCKSFRLT